MEAIGTLFLEICFQIFLTAIRPCRYLLSAEYRKELKNNWSGKSRISFYIYVFYGLIPFVLLIAYIIYHFYLKEPDPTKIEKAKSLFKLFDKLSNE